MATNPVGQVSPNLLPWGQKIADDLYSRGYQFSGNIISKQGFIDVYEISNEGQKLWVRVIDLSNAPSNYVQKMFPEGFQVPRKDLGEHVLPVLDIKVYENWIFVIIPSCATTLAKYNKHRPLCNQRGNGNRDWFSQIVAGLTNLLALGYYHGDLCPENVLIDERLKIQLAGYSMVPIGEQDRTEYYVGPNYRFRPPRPSVELYVEFEQCTGDVWALGILMYEILSGQYLVDPGSDMNSYFKSFEAQYEDGHILKKIRINKVLSDEAKHLIERLLTTNDAERPLIGWVADHGYFSDADVDISEYDLAYDVYEAPEGLEGSSERIPRGYQLDQQVEELVYSKGVRVKKYIASGSFGAVYRVKYNEQYCAMKVMKYGTSDRNMLAAEEDIAKSLKHPYVIRLFKVFKVKDFALIFLMELAFTDLEKQIGNLGTTTKENADMVARNMRKYLHHFAQGLAYCHSLNIGHNDIKPDNCLIRDNDTAAVADFGLATRTKKGSPEQFSKFTFDVFLFGSTVEECLMGVNRLTDMHNPIEEDVYSKTYPTLPSFVPELARDLINACRNKDKQKRLTMAQVAHHPWFTSGGPDLPPLTTLVAEPRTPQRGDPEIEIGEDTLSPLSPLSPDYSPEHSRAREVSFLTRKFL